MKLQIGMAIFACVYTRALERIEPAWSRRLRGWKTLLAVLLLAMARPACAALQSGAYQTTPGATGQEVGDRVPNESRVVPLFATLTFNLDAVQPSLTAVITNAVLEGGNPFTLTVRSSSGSKLVDGTYEFTGDYLKELYPSGTQYIFDWRFSTATNGNVVWDGAIYWAGGHIWQLTVSNIALVPVPQLSISPVGNASVRISWGTNFAGFILEQATSLPGPGWSTVTNDVTHEVDRLSVTLDKGISNRFYRLRQP